MSLATKPVRTCRTLHECCLCGLKIYCGDPYHDGGYGKRAHVRCVAEVVERTKPVFTSCNVCGNPLRYDSEFACGVCADCGEETI